MIKKGFSLIEVLIAFSVLTITVLAAATLLSSTIRNNEENVYRLQAYFLAQQGIEAIRNTRDSNWVHNVGFQTAESDIYPTNADQFSLTVEPIFNASGSLSGEAWKIRQANDANSKLYLKENAAGIKSYTHEQTEEESPFARTIKITKVEDEQLAVISSVQYNFRGNEKEINLKTILTNWNQ